MAQVIDRTVGANPTGFNMRTELNNIIAALENDNSGSSDPLNPVPYMKWLDTSNATYYYYKERNHDNTAWVTLFRYTVATKVMEAVSNEVVLQDSALVHKTGDTMTGNLNFASGTKITGDFSNATQSSRTALQTNVVDSPSTIGVLPNGTSMISGIRVFNSSNPTNSSYGLLQVNATEVRVVSDIFGTGTYLPMMFYTSGIERMKIDTSGNVLVTGPGIGYGTGAGGTVTQLTSKSTDVTLNKPTGQIIMNNAALAAGAQVQFNFLNSLVTNTDTIEITLKQPSSVVPMLIELTWGVDNGLVQIGVRNNHTSSLSESLILNFTVIKGATA